MCAECVLGLFGLLVDKAIGGALLLSLAGIDRRRVGLVGVRLVLLLHRAEQQHGRNQTEELSNERNKSLSA